MKRRGKLLFALFAAVSLLFLSVVTPAMGEGRLYEGEGCTVSGHVYVVETGKPLRGAAVLIHRISDSYEDITSTERRDYVTVTNGEGYYEFVGISSGLYILVVAYGSDADWGWYYDDTVCMGTFGSVGVGIAISIAGIYYASFEVEDGDSIEVDAAINPIDFYKSYTHTFSPIRTYENIYHWVQDAGFTITGPRGNSVAIRPPGIIPPLP